jgi:hypothetical protein
MASHQKMPKFQSSQFCRCAAQCSTDLRQTTSMGDTRRQITLEIMSHSFATSQAAVFSCIRISSPNMGNHFIRAAVPKRLKPRTPAPAWQGGAPRRT